MLACKENDVSRGLRASAALCGWIPHHDVVNTRATQFFGRRKQERSVNIECESLLCSSMPRDLLHQESAVTEHSCCQRLRVTSSALRGYPKQGATRGNSIMNHRNWSSVRLLAWLLPAVALASCSSIVGDEAVRIRVRNASAVDFDSTNIVFQSETERYGGIRAGRSTDYRAVGLAYRYARIEVWVGNSPSLLQPIDFRG